MSETSRLCLFQQNAQTVMGRAGDREVAGIVQRDGELVLGVSHGTEGLTVLSGRLDRDTLRLVVRISTPPPALREVAGQYVRSSGGY